MASAFLCVLKREALGVSLVPFGAEISVLYRGLKNFQNMPVTYSYGVSTSYVK